MNERKSKNEITENEMKRKMLGAFECMRDENLHASQQLNEVLLSRS